MKNTTNKEFGDAMKKMAKETGIAKSHFNQSRIAGWGKSSSGISYTYPRFDWSYQREYRKIKNYSTEEFEEMRVKYDIGDFSHEQERASADAVRFVECFRNYVSPDVYEQKGDEFMVRIANPFYGKS